MFTTAKDLEDGLKKSEVILDEFEVSVLKILFVKLDLYNSDPKSIEIDSSFCFLQLKKVLPSTDVEDKIRKFSRSTSSIVDISEIFQVQKQNFNKSKKVLQNV